MITPKVWRVGAIAALLVLGGCSEDVPNEPVTEELSYHSLPDSCDPILAQVREPITEFLSDLLNPAVPGTLGEEKSARSTTAPPNAIECGVDRARLQTDPSAPVRDLSRWVDITFQLSTGPMHRPSGAVPVPLLGDSAYQDTSPLAGLDGAVSKVAFRVRNLDVKVTAAGGNLGPSTPAVADRAKTTAMTIATELEEHIDDLMPYPTK
ncbi:hypothetical protein ACFXK0_28940 [Nocardia sp. NPDC059177]|uniref:hypothetical protein n=1 Tax=Nocardia sp. NPDC059177 TaxID=3346759 RepID=UPI00368CD9BA